MMMVEGRWNVEAGGGRNVEAGKIRRGRMKS
jgi:hypothetical protein